MTTTRTTGLADLGDSMMYLSDDLTEYELVEAAQEQRYLALAIPEQRGESE
jgi:hypothetical protein